MTIYQLRQDLENKQKEVELNVALRNTPKRSKFKKYFLRKLF